MVANPRTPRFLLTGILFGWGLAVAAITLTRAGADSSQSQILCMACGARGLADLIANWVLFIPLGMAAARLWSPRTAIGVSLVVTLGIEGLQQLLPGRVPALQDILMNTLGGATGAWIVLRSHTPAPFRAVAGLAAIWWLSTPFLLVPATSSGEMFGQWASPIGGFETYQGQVLSADVGGVPLPSTRIPDEESARRALTEREPVNIRFVVGPPPTALAPIVSVLDWHERPIFLLGAIRNDLVLRGRNTARMIRLDQPDVRWAGALSEASIGDTVLVRVESGRGSLCMSVEGTTRCRLAPGPGDGWAFLLNLEGGPELLRVALAVGWALGIGFMMGLAPRTPMRGVAAGIGLAALGLVAGFVFPDLRPAPIHAACLAAGALVGALVRRRLLDASGSGPQGAPASRIQTLSRV